MKNRIIKEIEYPDAPSGFVKMYNYKEPFMKFKSEFGSFGFEGVLLFDGTSDKVQCHLCGDWFKSLPHHIFREHNMRSSYYKSLVGLRQTTALIGESTREKLILSAINSKKVNNLIPGRQKTNEQREKISYTLKNSCRETQNERGTCPEQLIERLKTRAKELGRCPTQREISFLPTLTKVYGNFREACIIAGLNPLKLGRTLVKSKFTIEYTKGEIKKFFEENNHFPNSKSISSTLWNSYKKQKREIDKMILSEIGIFQKTGQKVHYSKKELLDFLVRFRDNNGRDPSISDCKRGLLPRASVYYYNFGNFRNALKQI